MVCGPVADDCLGRISCRLPRHYHQAQRTAYLRGQLVLPVVHRDHRDAAPDQQYLDPGVDLFRLITQEHLSGPGLEAVICDEAQFYAPYQIDQLARVVDEFDIEVYAFGLLATFQAVLFEGSKRLLELADVRSELQVEARCWCGDRATHNARLVNGVQVYDGEITVVGDTGGEATVSYDLRCRKHWLEGKHRSEQDALFVEARPARVERKIVS